MGVSPPLLPRPEGGDLVIHQEVKGFSFFLKREGKSLEVLFLSLFLISLKTVKLSLKPEKSSPPDEKGAPSGLARCGARI